MIYFLASMGVIFGYVLGAITNFLLGPAAIPALILLVALLWAYRLKNQKG